MSRHLAARVRGEAAGAALELDVRELCARFTIDIPPGTARRRLLRSLAPWLPKPRVYTEQVTDFFRGLVRTAARLREDRAPAARRTDFMQLLLTLREHGSNCLRIS
ncbi:Protein of unknown function [Gryllus bimaculatus]|nr:Protein of unknown function [Gryllus bimaculatus]